MTQLMEQIKEKDAQAFTHSGKFHADDVFSSALLLSVNPEITIHRGSQVPEDFKGIVFDIGRGKYDHHQRDSRIRENGVPYAAFGLLWEELGAEILGEELAEKFDEAFVQPLDNNDNTGEKNELATLIGNFNPPWDAQGGNDAAFFKAVGVAGMILDNKLERYRGNERADKRVEEILKQHQKEIASGKKPADEKQILVLPDYVPCQKYLSETDIAFVIFPSNRGGYCIQPQKREYSLNYKCSFQESWLGLEKEELNLNMMIEQIIDDFYPMVKELNKSIKFTSGENITIYADSDKLSRVFNNLVKNAISYSKENTDIDIKMYKSNNEVNIEVINRGKMIPKDKLDRIFENFYRLDTSRTSKTGGSGLGLAISKQIVELHDGKIIVASDKDKTIFKVSLPIKDE